MMFTCGSLSCAAKKPASRKTVAKANKSFGVDLHCHIHTPAADLIAQKIVFAFEHLEQHLGAFG